MKTIINENNNDDNNNSNDAMIKLINNARSKYFLLRGLSRKRMGLLKKKFYFLIKI